MKHMSKYKVHNLKEGDDPVPSGYTSWLDYWEKATGITAPLCRNEHCPELFAKATDGAHVQLDTPSDKHWYIIPLCHKCNCQFGAHLFVDGPLVSITDPGRVLW